MKLRPYQEKAVDAIQKEWKEGKRRLLLVMATGCGKTIVFSEIARQEIEKKGRVLILAHREELLRQAAEKIESGSGLLCAIEKAKKRAPKDAPVVIASVQTLAKPRRLHTYQKDTFSLIIVDEAHHSVASTYQDILTYFTSSRVLGVTATPNRADRKSLSRIYDGLAFEYNFPQAVHEGYLTNVRAQTVPLELDISKVKVMAGDFQAKALGSAIAPYLVPIAKKMKEYCLTRKTIVFLPLVHLAKEFTRLLTEEGFSAAEVDNQSANRQEILQGFRDGEYNVLCNAMILTEGFDDPSVDCIVILRPTKSFGLYAQMVGRGTRLYPGKKDLLLLDFLWLTARHDLCHPAELLAPSEEVARRMTSRIQKATSGISLADALEESLAEMLAENSRRDPGSEYLVELSRKLNSSDISLYEPTFQWELKAPTNAQLMKLQQFGIRTEFVKSRGFACLLISKLVARQNQRPASSRQQNLLARYGIPYPEEWTFGQANKLIGIISLNEWHLPQNIEPRIFSPKALSEDRYPSLDVMPSEIFDRVFAPAKARRVMPDFHEIFLVEGFGSYPEIMKDIIPVLRDNKGTVPVFVFNRLAKTGGYLNPKYWVCRSDQLPRVMTQPARVRAAGYESDPGWKKFFPYQIARS